MPPKGTQITPAFFEPSLDEYLTLVGSCVKNAAGIWVPVSATNPMPTTAQDGSIVAIGAKGDAAVTDPTLAASEIALLKGLIKQLQTGPNLVQLSGSNLAEATTLNVTLAGTRQQLPDIACSQVMIIAKRDNTGYIYVGKNTVSSTVYGAELGELDCVVLPVSNANEIYIDASVSGEGISYVAI